MASSSRGHRLSLRATEASSEARSAGHARGAASKSTSDALGLDIDPLEMSKEELDPHDGKRHRDKCSEDRGSTKRIQQQAVVHCTAGSRGSNTLPTINELAQRGILVLFKHASGPARSKVPSGVRKLCYVVLERALEARKAIKLSHAQQLRDARINGDKVLGYLLADMLDEELPTPEEAERRGKRVAAHFSAETKRIDQEKVRFAEQVRAAKRSVGEGGISEADLRQRLADIASAERAAIQGIQNEAYAGWVRPSSPASRAASAQRESTEPEPEPELTPEEQEQVQLGLADDFTRRALNMLLEPFFTERDLAAQGREGWIQRSHIHLWRATSEANLLAAGLVERSLLDMLRDRDTDLEYYRGANALICEVNGGLKQEIKALQAQVRELGGTPCEPVGGMSFADINVDGMHQVLNGEE